ncbi:dUTP diphosphatase [Virgibacillus sp. W0430]|uniref:dUTP diphosphatase n=1 Tax=Virgibacillus sp. W0430 TaxID=3391580 RepID=UPI003F476F6B
MNLSKLFEMQTELDARILLEKQLVGQDLLDKKILALQVELGELANEWRGFKFWKVNKEPNEWIPNENDVCKECNGQPIFYDDVNKPTKIIGQCENCDGCGVHFYNPLLEEYVDCLHFILSIGLELGIKSDDVCVEGDLTGATTTEAFNELFSYVSTLNTYLDVNLPASITNADINEAYKDIFECFVGLGESDLGFTWEQIEQAYMDKNKVNHARQNEGY